MPELLAAVLLLQVAGILAAAALATSFRLDGIARDRVATDLGRRDTLLARAAALDCRQAPAPEARPVVLPSAPGRPTLHLAIRCGR